MKKGVTMTLSYQTSFIRDKEIVGKLGISGVLLDGRRQGVLIRLDEIAFRPI